MGDIDIKLDDGRLTVKGQRVAASDSSRFTSKFSQTFSLDPTVDVESFTATLNNGVLVVSAPKDLASWRKMFARSISLLSMKSWPKLIKTKKPKTKKKAHLMNRMKKKSTFL